MSCHHGKHQTKLWQNSKRFFFSIKVAECFLLFNSFWFWRAKTRQKVTRRFSFISWLKCALLLRVIIVEYIVCFSRHDYRWPLNDFISAIDHIEHLWDLIVPIELCHESYSVWLSNLIYFVQYDWNEDCSFVVLCMAFVRAKAFANIIYNICKWEQLKNLAWKMERDAIWQPWLCPIF